MSVFARPFTFLRRRLWTAKGLGIVVLVVIVWIFVAWFAAKSLIVNEPLDRSDVIVVLSGSATYSERANKATELYRAGVSRKIILMNDNRQGGWSQAEERNPYFYERARAQLFRGGVAADDVIVLPEPVYGTHDEAVLLRKQMDALGFRSMNAVTSAYHSRRARWILQKTFAGTEVKIGIDAVPPGKQTPPPATWWLHLQGWEDVPLEYVKIVYYRFRY